MSQNVLLSPVLTDSSSTSVPLLPVSSFPVMAAMKYGCNSDDQISDLKVSVH